AKRMVQFLKQNKAGRATFLPLDAVKERGGASEDVRREKGVIGYAADLVDTEERFRSVIAFLLGRIVVADTIDNALQLAKKYKYSLRIVTLEGEQLNPGGSISGGAYKNASNLLGRRREVDEAQKRVEQLGERLASMEERRNTLRISREEISKRLEESKAALQEEFLLQNTAKLELDRIEKEAQEHLSSYDEIHKELLEIEVQEKELTENIERMEQELREHEEAGKRNDVAIEECAHLLDEERRLEQYALEKGESLRMELGTVKQQSGFLAENVARVEGELATLAGEESQLSDEGAGAVDAVSEKEALIERTRHEIETLYKLCGGIEKEAEDITKRREEVTAKHKLLIDFHGMYKPTGLSRTYPNVINYEGVFGLEQLKWTDRDRADMPLNDVLIPYIRMAAGPMDYTQGAMLNAAKGDFRAIDKRPMSQGTRAHQVAMYVVYDAPFSMLCDTPSNYLREEETTRYIASIPTVFDSSKVLSGKVGEHIVMARQKDGVWYVGGLTSWVARDVEVDFSFLGEGEWEVALFRDGINADLTGLDYKTETKVVKAGDKLPIHMAPGGGFAMIIKQK
ncbi:MAG: glycoside hydrolase family 97 catalytic domain-containing protein, partial [Akkermansia sp.]|nr:glycoside hydrolase family 97 catalytic domain-containing protein [Akkermansia sp.]